VDEVQDEEGVQHVSEGQLGSGGKGERARGEEFGKGMLEGAVEVIRGICGIVGSAS